MPKIPCPIPKKFVAPASLAKERGCSVSVIMNWINRDLLEYMELPQVARQRYLVNRETAPEFPGSAGRPPGT